MKKINLKKYLVEQNMIQKEKWLFIRHEICNQTYQCENKSAHIVVINLTTTSIYITFIILNLKGLCNL